MNRIDIHADDYGYTLNTSKDIIDCMKKGALNSISIICNTSFFEESIEMLYKEIPTLPFLPLMSVHINLVEGFNLSNTNLLSKNGINFLSWTNILFKSTSIKNKELKNELKDEIRSQIRKTELVINRCIEIAEKNNIKYYQKGIRIDSHVHTHSIPIVFDALIDVIKEENLNVEYIRNPKEPLVPFIKQIGLWRTYSLINIIKNQILNIFSIKIDNFCEDIKIEKSYLWGLIMSGKMDSNRIEKIYDSMINKTNNNKRYLEILFHPGRALDNEKSEELNIDYMKNFNLSYNRSIEKESVLNIKR